MGKKNSVYKSENYKIWSILKSKNFTRNFHSFSEIEYWLLKYIHYTLMNPYPTFSKNYKIFYNDIQKFNTKVILLDTCFYK